MTSKKRMRIKKTRKLNENKKKTRRHKFIRKNRFFGGDNLTSDSKADEIMNEVKKERELKMNFNLGDNPVIKKSRELAEGLTIKGIQHLGILLGVDLSSSQSINERLEKIRLAFTDPKNQEKVREILNEAANVGNVAIEAASPFIKPLIDKTVDLGSEALSKLGESAVKIGLNTAEEIPGVGVVLGTVRSLNDAGEAILAASNAASEVVTTTSDSINAATKNFERLIKEKMQGLNRINESVNNFQTPFNRDQLLKMASSKAPNLTGGNIGKKYKKMKPISI